MTDDMTNNLEQLFKRIEHQPLRGNATILMPPWQFASMSWWTNCDFRICKMRSPVDPRARARWRRRWAKLNIHADNIFFGGPILMKNGEASEISMEDDVDG